MSAKILLFGATGHAGRAIAHELVNRGHTVTAVVRDEARARPLLPDAIRYITASATQPDTLRGICQGQEIVLSALGKSVSPNDWSTPTFEQVDLQANLNILQEAKSAAVQQFIYLSAFHSAQLRHLTYFRVHDDFSNALKISGLHYVVIQPPAIMSAFIDLLKMARNGLLFTIGDGNCRTNPISERDLAKVCADAIGQPDGVVAAGGQQVYTRHEINVLIQQQCAPGKTIRKIPAFLLRAALPFWKIVNRNLYDKLAFFNEVIHLDLLAPQVGTESLETYLSRLKH